MGLAIVVEKLCAIGPNARVEIAAAGILNPKWMYLAGSRMTGSCSIIGIFMSTGFDE